MNNLSLRITDHRTGFDQTIAFAPQNTVTNTLRVVVDGIPTAGDHADNDALVPAEPFELQYALEQVSSTLGCANTLDDMLHSIDALRAAAPPRLEWSATLCNGERVNHAAAEKACAALGEGWRLPTRTELLSLVDDTRCEPAIDTERFPDTKSAAYWTSTLHASDSSYAWIVYFLNGDAYDCHRDVSLAFVRAVRAVPAGQ